MPKINLNIKRTPEKIVKEYKRLGRSVKQIRTLANYMKHNGSLEQKKIGKGIRKVLKSLKKQKRMEN